MKVLALTGGIASGKTSVGLELEACGGALIDADVVAREVVEPGTPALEAIAREFGPEAIGPDGRMDRAWVARRVFGDEAALARLNGIVHPAVKEGFQARLAELSRRVPPPSFVVLVVPLLFEARMERMADEVWVVSVPVEEQRRRLMTRDGFTEAEADARIASQMPLAEKIRRANRVIDNTGSPEETRRQVRAALVAEGLC